MLLKLISFIFLLGISFSKDMYQQVRIEEPTPYILHLIQTSGVAIDHAHTKMGSFIEFAATTEEVLKLNDLGLNPVVLIDDLELFYQSRLTNDFSNLDRDFDYGSMGGYYTLDEIYEHLIDLSTNYPSLVGDIQVIGSSLEGRDIWAIKLSDNVDIDEDEPEVLYTGLHHAREPMSYMNLFYFMYWLVENYNTDLEAKGILDNRELWFIPAVNPDGLIYNQSIAPNGGGMQRKNTRETCPSSNDWTDWNGIDLNRNYSYNWAFDDFGSNPNPCSQTYRGSAPFSEPETQAIRDFVDSHDFPIAFNYHSYGNLLIHPFGHLAGEYPPEQDLEVFRALAEEMTRFNGYQIGTGIETVGYTVNGEACDWMYGEHGIFSYTPEIGSSQDGFWPSTDRIVELAEQNLYSNKAIAWASGAFFVSDLNFSSSDFIQGEEYILNYKISNIGTQSSVGNVIVEIAFSLSNHIETIDLGVLQSQEFFESDISFQIPVDAANGQSANFYISVYQDNDYKFNYNKSIVLGSPILYFSDDAEVGMQNWSSESTLPFISWGISSDSFQGTFSFTDSPQGEYQGNWAVNSMLISEPLNFSSVSSSYLDFFARWDIEESWDWCQILGSIDSTNWVPLFGEKMSAGSGNGAQSSGEFGYDGVSNWVQDRVDLSMFSGNEKVWIKFQIDTDSHVVSDGIYLDEINVYAFDYIENQYNIGDGNMDGNINVLDIILCVNVIVNSSEISSQAFNLLDVDQNLELNVLDIVQIVNFILE